jgi:hypothetical protein
MGKMDSHGLGHILLALTGSPKPRAVCRVESGPQRGAFPTVGINLGPGLPRGRPFPLDPPPPTADWQIASADGAETD